MKVAVSALGPSLDDRVDERFGRAAYLLMVDDDTLAVEAVDNSANREALEGAGLGAAELVCAAHVGAVITGHLGPKAFRALALTRTPGFDGSGMSVREAVGAWKDGRLEELGEGEGHAGFR